MADARGIGTVLPDGSINLLPKEGTEILVVEE